MKAILLVLILYPAAAFCQVAQKAPTINIFTDSKTAGKGLLLLFPDEISVSAKQPGQFTFRVVNTLEEEVFLRVTGFDETSWTLRDDDGFGAAAGKVTEGRTNLYQLLTAARYEDGKARFIAPCFAKINGQLYSFGKMVSPSWVGKQVELSIMISGFYRASGRLFHETVDLRLTVVK